MEIRKSRSMIVALSAASCGAGLLAFAATRDGSPPGAVEIIGAPNSISASSLDGNSLTTSQASAINSGTSGTLSVPTYPALNRISEVDRLYVSGKYIVEVRKAGATAAVPSTVFEARNDWVLRDFFNPDPARRNDVKRSRNQYGDGKSDVRTASFTRFSFADTAVDVTVRLKDASQSINSAVVRPLRHSLQPVIAPDKKSLTFRLHAPRKMSVEINGRLDPLFILPDHPRTANTAATYYYGPGVHRIAGPTGTLQLGTGESVYIAAGAIVEGRFVIKPGSRDVRIEGEGILSRGEWEHTSTDYSYLRANATIWSDYASRVTISGLTIVNSNAWQIAMEDYSPTGNITGYNTYKNLNLITFAGNTDAFWLTGQSNNLSDSFVFNNDDLFVSKGGAGTSVTNVVAWGGAWGRFLLLHPLLKNVNSINNLNISRVDVIGKEGGDTLIKLEDNNDGKNISNVTLRDVRFEERRRPGNTNNNPFSKVSFITLEDSVQRGRLSNFLFENVTLDNAVADEGFIRGSAAAPLGGFTFRNFRRGGTKATNTGQLGISFNSFVSDVKVE